MENPDSTVMKNDQPLVQLPLAGDKSSAGIGDFARSLAYSAVQVPAEAVAQIVDKATGSKLADNLTLVNKPDEADFGSVKWHVQQVGSAIGGLVPFLGAFALTRSISNANRMEELALAYSKGTAASTASMFRTGEMATAGFVQGSILEPNQNSDQMLTERLSQGISSGAVMGSMHVISNKLSALTGASLTDASLLNKSLTTGLAGAGAGVVGLGVNKLFNDQPSTAQQDLQSVYQAAFTGAALGGIGGMHFRLHQPTGTPTALEEFAARDKKFMVSDSTYLDWQKQSWAPWRTPSEVHSVLNSSDLTNLPNFSPLEKAELVGIMHRDADPLLRKPEVIQSFINQIEGTWTDDLRRTTDEYDEALRRAQTLAESRELQLDDGSESKQDGRDFAAIKRLSKKQDAKIDALYDAREEALEQHRQRLETAVNEFLVAHDLPTIQLMVQQTMETDAAYSFGRVRLNGDQLVRQESQPTLINHLYHELTHLRQDTLDIQLLADELGVPRHPSDDQKALVQDVFKQLTAARFVGRDDVSAQADTNGSAGESDPNFDLDDDNRLMKELNARKNSLVEKVLALRADTLTGDDLSLAERMRDAEMNYVKQLHVDGLFSTEDQRDNVTNMIERATATHTATVLNDVISDPDRFRRLFGFATVPEEFSNLAREHEQDPQRLSDAQISDPVKSPTSLEQYLYYDELAAKMKPVLNQQLSTLDARFTKLMHQRMQQYLSTDLERQAFPTGILAELTYRANQRAAS